MKNGWAAFRRSVEFQDLFYRELVVADIESFAIIDEGVHLIYPISGWIHVNYWNVCTLTTRDLHIETSLGGFT